MNLSLFPQELLVHICTFTKNSPLVLVNKDFYCAWKVYESDQIRMGVETLVKEESFVLYHPKILKDSLSEVAEQCLLQKKMYLLKDLKGINLLKAREFFRRVGNGRELPFSNFPTQNKDLRLSYMFGKGENITGYRELKKYLEVWDNPTVPPQEKASFLAGVFSSRIRILGKHFRQIYPSVTPSFLKDSGQNVLVLISIFPFLVHYFPEQMKRLEEDVLKCCPEDQRIYATFLKVCKGEPSYIKPYRTEHIEQFLTTCFARD